VNAVVYAAKHNSNRINAACQKAAVRPLVKPPLSKPPPARTSRSSA